MKIKVFHFLLGFTLKQKGVLYFCFPTKRQIMLSTILPPPSISAVIATLECVWKKRRRGQQHSVSPCHMDQHISHQGTAGVFFYMLLQIFNHALCLYSRWRNVHAQRTRSLELSTGEKRCQRWDNKEGELLLFSSGSLYCLLWCYK